jgi:hypothetical protein
MSYLRGLLIFSVGCGSVAGGGSGTDAALSDSTPADTGVIDTVEPDAPPAARCDLTKPFGTPTVVPGINGALKDIQAVQANATTLFLSTDRAGTTDIYTSTRAAATDAWGAPTPVTALATASLETSPYLTADGLTMLYAYSPIGSVNADIYFSTRTTTTAAFPAGTPIAAVNSAEDDGDVTITGDGALMYFASSRAGTGGYDLYQSTRGLNGYGAPVLLAPINTTVYDAHPRVTADGLRLYYSSMRTDGGALAGADIWTATRASTTVAFDSPTRVTELNTASNESPTWISADGCEIYLQSNRAGTTGDQDIWSATKPL